MIIQFVLSIPMIAFPVANADYPSPVFLPKDAINVTRVLAPAPHADSAQNKTDFDEILRLQNTRSSEECQRAAFVVDVSLNTLFGPAYGPLSSEEAQLLSMFFEKIRVDIDYFVQEAKAKWKRPRPYVFDNRVQPCVKREVTNAYPSGHAAISRTFARVLSELYPERAKQFLARADQIGHDRVLAGVHHPTDIKSGIALGELVYQRLNNNRQFIKMREIIKANVTHRNAWGVSSQ